MCRWVIFLPISLLLGNSGCSREVAVGPTSPTSSPSHQFVITNLEIEEDNNTDTVWKAVAQRATGNLKTTEVQDLVVTHKVQDGENTVILKAPTGTLWPLTHDVVLKTAILEDSFNRVMTISELAYSRKEETIQGAGPIDIQGPNISLNPGEISNSVQTGNMTLSGPIRGTVQVSRPQFSR